MSLQDLLSLTAIKNGLSVGGIVFVVVASLLQVSKININPWDWVLGLIGNKLNNNLKKEIQALKKEMNDVASKLDSHISESEAKELQDTRRDILEFANSCMNGRKHTKEQFDFVIAECDAYEKYIEDKDIKNGFITSAIREIRRLNDKCIQTNSFLKEREYE